MKNKLLVAIMFVVLVGFGIYVWYTIFQTKPEIPQTIEPEQNTSDLPESKPPVNVVINFDPLNATYTIDEKPVRFTNGKNEEIAAPGSATSISTVVFGVPTVGFINNDDIADAAVILVRDMGGSGVFYYVAAALNINNIANGTNAVFLGDRIAPQNIQITDGKIIVNYAERKPGEAMSVQPSVGVSKFFTLNGEQLKALDQSSK
jgi:hypothetical protein